MVSLARITAAVAAVLALAPAAHAEHTGRPSQPACTTSAHFVIHCDAGVENIDTIALAADFEEAYARSVAGAGGEPNAGIVGPVDDGDGKTDVYMQKPPSRPTFSGGIMFRDPNHTRGRGQAAFLFMTPDLERDALRFRAGHEFIHVLMRAAFGVYGIKYEESIANWGAENALPDVDPGDNYFRSPQRSLDCVSETCGQGYAQWVFFLRQTEDYGPGFIGSLFTRMQAAPDYRADIATPALRDELAARTGLPPDQALRVRFADYARKIWDPTAWRSTAIATIHRDTGLPAAEDIAVGPGFKQTGPKGVAVDHLAARYARLRVTDGQPDDELRVTVTPPAGLLATPEVSIGPDAGPRQITQLAPDGAGGFATTIAGPSSNQSVVIPLINDTEGTDGMQFGWHAEYQRASSRLKVPRQRGATVRKRGLSVRVTATKPAVVRLAASVDAKTARKYKLGRRATRVTANVRKPVGAGTATVVLKLTAKARRALARAGSIRLTITGNGTFPRGTKISLNARTTLKR